MITNKVKLATVPGKVAWKVTSGKTPENEDGNYQPRTIYGDCYAGDLHSPKFAVCGLFGKVHETNASFARLLICFWQVQRLSIFSISSRERQDVL
jgi:hypothetical protein